MSPAKPLPERRVFTVAEANALLPALEETFGRIHLRRAELDEASRGLQILDVLWGDGVRAPANPDHHEFLGHQEVIQRVLGEIEELVGTEVLVHGIRFPVGGLEQGILDFPTTWKGRWVFLCWQRGEPRVSVWHEIHAGFAGRRILTPEQEDGMGLEDPAGMDDSRLDV